MTPFFKLFHGSKVIVQFSFVQMIVDIIRRDLKKRQVVLLIQIHRVYV